MLMLLDPDGLRHVAAMLVWRAGPWPPSASCNWRTGLRVDRSVISCIRLYSCCKGWWQVSARLPRQFRRAPLSSNPAPACLASGLGFVAETIPHCVDDSGVLRES